jgi:AcrR family transcriptional regulator
MGRMPSDHADGGPDVDRILEPQQDRSQESTRRLLDAAAELVAERGYAGATIAAIGERAGYSRGLVSARFRSKDNLIWALVQRSTDAWFQDLDDDAAHGTGLDRLLHLVDLIGDHAASDARALRVLERLIFEASGATAELQERFAESQRRMEARFAELFARGVADGSITRPVDPTAEAALLVATLRGISYQWFLYPEAVEIRVLHGVLVDGLRARLTH